MTTVHVLPLDDLVSHDIPGGWDGHGPGCPDCTGRWLVLEAGTDKDADCACNPSVELVPRDDGPDGYLLTHHSLDGREQHEQGHQPTP